MPQHISVSEAAKILNVTPHYVRRLIQMKRILGQQMPNSNRWEIDLASLSHYKSTDILQKDLLDMQTPNQISISEALIEIEDKFEGDAISLAMSNSFIDHNDPISLNHLLSNLTPSVRGNVKKFKRLIFILHSPGGYLEAAIKIVGIAKTYCDELVVIVPFIAKSAASLIALKADKLYLTPCGELGPIDPMIPNPSNPSQALPAHAIEALLTDYSNHVHNSSHSILGKFSLEPFVFGSLQAAKKFAESEFKKAIEKFLLHPQEEKKLTEIFFNNYSHAYPIIYNDISVFKIAENIDDHEKMQSLNILMNSINIFMGTHSIIKIMSNRVTNINVILPSTPSTQVRQKSVQTSN